MEHLCTMFDICHTKNITNSTFPMYAIYNTGTCFSRCKHFLNFVQKLAIRSILNIFCNLITCLDIRLYAALYFRIKSIKTPCILLPFIWPYHNCSYFARFAFIELYFAIHVARIIRPYLKFSDTNISVMVIRLRTRMHTFNFISCKPFLIIVLILGIC